MKSTKIHRGLLIVFACLLACFAATVLAAQDQNQDQYPDQNNGNPPGVAARISSLQGNVSFQPSGQNDWSQATLNYTLTTGDRIYTDQGANAELEVGPYTVRMGAATDVTVANLTDQLMQLGVAQGTVRVGVYELPAGNAVEIDTPNGALDALGPGSYRVDIDPNNGSRAIVDSGSLQISGGGVNQTIARGQAVELTGTNPIQVTSIDFPRPDGFDEWYETRDRRIQEFRSRQYMNPYTPGAEDLDNYGTWSSSQYGPVWYPSNVGSDWVPYRQGHWSYVGSWGWTWVDDEPWGYAPFHYGRWAEVGSRWGWIPGPVNVSPVYSPALVAFVGGSGFSVGVSVGGGGGLAGWFPLGPTDPFIPWYHYQGNYLRQVNVTNVRNVTNITNITNITNSTNVTSINTTNIHYAYRTVATTAVPAAAFSSGQPVARSVVRVAAAQLARAQVIARPTVKPAPTAVFAGKTPAVRPAVSKPPVRLAKLTVPPRTPAGRAAIPAHAPTPARPAPAPARPTPGARPTPTPHPAPAARPGPERARPTPEARPAPAAHPAPSERPAPRPAPHAAPERATPAHQAAPKGHSQPEQKPKQEKREPPAGSL
jgi:hypothetical protein